eukprot:TRINITY_DN4107_c0_g1_i1.p1 TRINITY_DN4107_c0_g1~~TRINITY_DN4107_c0_g1_i1.p1  ORF type:complete len:458 (-),score=47.24 TRINITY_DN4107_c0_g1_i1:2394-3590(-)
MSIRPYVAIKYDVNFEECPYSADEFCNLVEQLKEHDVITWHNDNHDFELDRGELNNLLESGDLDGDGKLKSFVKYLLANGEPNLDYIKIQLYQEAHHGRQKDYLGTAGRQGHAGITERHNKQRLRKQLCISVQGHLCHMLVPEQKTERNKGKLIMQERKITRSIEPISALVVITEDQGEKIGKALKDLNFNLVAMVDSLNKGTLTEEMRACHCSLSEHYLRDLLKELGYNGQLHMEMEKRVAEIRSLNQENRELRKQLGDRVTNEDFRERAKNIKKIIYDWWNKYGFGHLSDEWFDGSGQYHATLSGLVFDHGEHGEQTKADYLASLGFEIECTERENVVDNDNNRQILMSLLEKRFPSVIIYEWRGVRWNSTKAPKLREVEICIRDLNDIQTGEDEQ